MTVLFGASATKQLPDPEKDAAAFAAAFEALQQAAPQPHNVLHAGQQPWVNLEALDRHLHGEAHSSESRGHCVVC
jgi:hypothetical protein